MYYSVDGVPKPTVIGVDESDLFLGNIRPFFSVKVSVCDALIFQNHAS